MNKINKKISNRIYPTIKCKHCSNPFAPTDARQKFCCPQHRIDYNNDARRVRYAPFKDIISRLTKNEAILKKIYLSLQEQSLKKTVAVSLLEYEYFDFTIYNEISSNPISGNKIYWYFSYGLEGMDLGKQSFEIYKRN